MPGASSVSSTGGNGGGTKRRTSDLAYNHSPGVGGATHSSSGNNTPSAGSTSGSICGDGRGGGMNGVLEGVGNEASGSQALSLIKASPVAGGGDVKTGITLPSPAVMKMKAEVFEKDRDNFLTTFEKPTQIYRFLRTRFVQSPIFLNRNLSYMKSRMSRSHNTRVGFDLEEFLKSRRDEKERNVTLRHPKLSPRSSYKIFNQNGPIKYYNVVVMGIADGQLWHPDTKAKIDVVIARVCMNKRKEAPGSLTKVYEKTVDFKVFSPSSPKPSQDITIKYSQKCPVLAIPAEVCSIGSNGHTVRSFKLVLRVTIPKKCLLSYNNNNQPGDHQFNHLNSRNSCNSDSVLDEPKAKRRRSAPATKDRENFIYGEGNRTGSLGAGGGNLGENKSDELIIYTGNISIYEHDIPGDTVREADFDIQLKKAQRGSGNKISKQRLRREISWESFDEKHAKVIEQAKTPGRCAKVCVAIRTSSDVPPSFVEPPPPLLRTAVTVKNEDGAQNDSKCSLAQLEMQKYVRVIYQFSYGNNSQQQTESRDDLRCPWCSVNCMLLYSLMKHLKLCHPRFHFTYSPIQNGARIDVAVNDSYDGSYSGSAFDLVCQPPGEAFARNGPTKRTEVFSILVCRPKPCRQSLQEFFECDEKDVDQRRTYITGHNRLYHHTSTCLPIHPREIDVDSEGEPDPEWLRVKTTMMIDEFTDVNEGEKELMKLWNLHVMKFNYVGDCQIEFACKRFVELHGKELIHKNLYRNFCLHLTNLFDFGLLTPQGVHNTIQQLHSQMRESSVSTVHLMNREGWKPKCHGAGINGLAAITEGTTITSLTYSPAQSFIGGVGIGGNTFTGNSNMLTTSTNNTASPKTAPATSSKSGNNIATLPITATSGVSSSNQNSSASSSSSNYLGSTQFNGSHVRKPEAKVKRFVCQ